MQYPDNLPEITDITDRFLTEDERQMRQHYSHRL
jgi:hypothetical protein